MGVQVQEGGEVVEAEGGVVIEIGRLMMRE